MRSSGVRASRIHRIVWLALLFPLGSLSAGCMLLVDAETTEVNGPTCHFDGEKTGCGRCIVRSCQKKVNACCAQETDCGAQLERLDACAKSPEASNCIHLSAFNPNAPPASADLNACVEEHCADECFVTAAAVCTGKAESECLPCCVSAFPSGHSSANAIDTFCACYNGACSDSCGDTAYCATDAPVPGNECLLCLTNEGVYGGRCRFAEQCSDDPECLSFTICFQACCEAAQ